VTLHSTQHRQSLGSDHGQAWQKYQPVDRAQELSEHLSDGLSKRCLVGGVEDAELADDEGLFQSGEDRLDSGRFEQAGGLPLLDRHLSDCENDGSRDVIGITTTSGLAVLYIRLLTMTAGRFFELVWLVNGNGTSTTSPNSKGIVNVVVRIIPDRGEGRLTHAGGGTSKRSILLTHANEIDEIFDLCNSISR
jgi:hypothetical protein